MQIEAARQDPARFAELYENNFDESMPTLCIACDREDAQDLTSEVFHQALASLSRFEWRGLPFIAWLLGIAAKCFWIARIGRQAGRGRD